MADEEKPTDLRSMIAETVAQAEITGREEPETTPGARSEPEVQAEEASSSSGGRQRDANGRFLPKEGESDEEREVAETAAASETTEKSAPTPTERAGGVEAPEHWSSSDKKWFSTLPQNKQQSYAARYKESGSPSEVPVHWSPADKEWVSGLPDEVKASVVDRFKQLESGFTPRLQKLSQIEKDYGGAMEVFAPHEHMLRSRGQTPSDVIRVYAGMEETLSRAKAAAIQDREDPKGAQLVANIIQNYKINPGTVAKFLTGEQVATPQPQQAYIPPELVQEIQGLKQTVSSWQYGSAQTQIDRFAQEKNADGSLRNPFFSELEPVITELAQFESSQGRPIDLPTLYQRALWSNESTRERQLSSQRQADEKRAAEDRKAKTEAARKASSSINGAPSPGAISQRAPAKAQSVRDTLLAAYDETASDR